MFFYPQKLMCFKILDYLKTPMCCFRLALGYLGVGSPRDQALLSQAAGPTTAMALGDAWQKKPADAWLVGRDGVNHCEIPPPKKIYISKTEAHKRLTSFNFFTTFYHRKIY